MANKNGKVVTTTICMLRHAEVDVSWRGRIYGCLDVPLSPEGREQSLRAAAALAGVPFAAVVSSGLARAEHTAAGLPTDGPREQDARFVEIDRGDWAGWTEAEIETSSPGGWREFWDSGGTKPPPGGESLEAVDERVVAALDDHANRAHASAGPIAIVAHRWVLRVAAARALGWPAASCAKIDLPYSGMLVLEWPRNAGPTARPSAAGARLITLSGAAHAGWYAQA